MDEEIGITTPPIVLPQLPDMYSDYEAHRAEANTYWDADAKAWRLLGYAECEFVERNEDVFAHPERPDLVTDPEMYEMIQQVNGGERALILLQGEQHRALHRAISRSLSRRMRDCRPEVRAVVDSYVGELDGPVDFIAAFADRLPTAVITAVLGLPWLGDQQLLQKARRCTTAIGLARITLERDSQVWKDGFEAAAELSEMLRPIVSEHRDSAEAGYIGELWSMGREIFDDWNEDDVVAQCRTLFFAGSNSSTHFLANIGYVLATNPAVWPRLRTQPERIRRFVEEVLRVVSPVQTRPRVAVQDVELDGQQIAAGDLVLTINGAANLDPRRYACPYELDIDSSPPGHLAFNTGPRTCVGAPTARVEGEEVVASIIRQFDRMELDPERPLPDFVGGWNTLFEPLHVIVGRAHNVAG
jgi:cytochrome P450